MIVVFDLDGTILDTYPIIRNSFISVFEKFLPDLHYTEDDLKSYFGPSLYQTFMKIVNDEKLTEKLIKEYRYFSSRNHKDVKAFSDVEKALKILKEKGHKLAILSNKMNQSINTGLNITNLRNYFDLIVGIDDVSNPKPNPEGLFNIMNHFKDENCLFVGDSHGDLLTSQAANIPFVGVTWAINDASTFEGWGADYTINNFNELIKIVEERNV